MTTAAVRSHWVCIVIGIWKYDEGGRLENLKDVEQELAEVTQAVQDSGLCEREDVYPLANATYDEVMEAIQKAVDSLKRGSKLLVVYMGHSYCDEKNRNHTWIVPSPGLKWNNCILLEDEVARQVSKEGSDTRFLDICWIFSSCRTDCACSSLAGQPETVAAPVYSSYDTHWKFYACPKRHEVMDTPFLGCVLASLLRAHPDSLQSLLRKLKDEVRYVSLGEVHPELLEDPTRDVTLFGLGVGESSGTAAVPQRPIMTDAVLFFLEKAVLIRQHLVELVSREISNYASARAGLAALADVVNVSSDLHWVFDLSLQLAVLKEESLLSVKKAVEKYKVENERLQERRVPQDEVNSWGKIPKESLRSFLTALCNREPTELTAEVSNAARKYLRKMAQAHREVSYPTSLGGASSGIRESVKIEGPVGRLSRKEQDNLFAEVTRLAEILNMSVDMAHFGTGCLLIVLILSRPLLVHQKQAFCGELHAYLQSKEQSSLAFARKPVFQSSLPRADNLVDMVESIRSGLKSPVDSCWLNVRGLKALMAKWIDEGNFESGSASSDFRLRIVCREGEMEDGEWLRGTSDLQVVAEPTWPFWRQSSAFKELDAELTGLLHNLSKREMDGGLLWADTASFMDLALVISSLAAEPDLRDLVLRALRGDEASRCQAPRDLEIHLWEEILAGDKCSVEASAKSAHHSAELPAGTMARTTGELGGQGYRTSMSIPSSSSTAVAEVEGEKAVPDRLEQVEMIEKVLGGKQLLHQIENFQQSKQCLLQLMAVARFMSAAAFPQFVHVLRGLSQPVATRGSSASDHNEEIDEELAQTLEKLRDDIEKEGVDRAIDLFIEEWN